MFRRPRPGTAEAPSYGTKDLRRSRLTVPGFLYLVSLLHRTSSILLLAPAVPFQSMVFCAHGMIFLLRGVHFSAREMTDKYVALPSFAFKSTCSPSPPTLHLVSSFFDQFVSLLYTLTYSLRGSATPAGGSAPPRCALAVLRRQRSGSAYAPRHDLNTSTISAPTRRSG
jgi:hypothetical protein